MNPRTLLLLALAAAAALAGGFWASSMRGPAATVSGVGAPLVEGLQEKLNDIEAIRLYTTAEDPAVTIRRSDEAWRVAQKDDYRADYGQVRKLLLALADARLLEEKTSNPEYYSRIGVQDVTAGGNVGVELDGVATPRVIIGNREASREAFYVRRAGEATSWLANGDIAAAADPMQWLDREVIDVSAASVAEVDITHADGETLQIAKSTFGQASFDVARLPDGAELERANVADPIASTLASLRFDDVASSTSQDFPEVQARVTWRTFDGLVIAADLGDVDGAYYARFEASTDAATAAKFQSQTAGGESGAPAASESDADNAGSDADADENSGAAAPAAAAPLDMGATQSRADQLNSNLSGWVFRLPRFKYDQMTRRLSDLLKSDA